MQKSSKQVLSDKTVDQLQESIGASVYQLQNVQSNSVSCSVDEYNIVRCTVSGGIRLTLSANNRFSWWSIHSIPLGDIPSGYDMYGLSILRTHKELSYEEWFKLAYPESGYSDFVLKPAGSISGIEIYGYYREGSEGQDAVALDMLVVLNMDTGGKIALTGSGREDSVHISIFGKRHLQQFQEWVTGRENDRGDKLFQISREL